MATKTLQIVSMLAWHTPSHHQRESESEIFQRCANEFSKTFSDPSGPNQGCQLWLVHIVALTGINLRLQRTACANPGRVCPTDVIMNTNAVFHIPAGPRRRREPFLQRGIISPHFSTLQSDRQVQGQTRWQRWLLPLLISSCTT